MDRKIFRLKGKVQHYAWGGSAFIYQLLGKEPDGKPAAEYWLGAHELAPAEILEDNKTVLLDKVIANDPASTIGSEVSKSFGRLPYLLKILDVKDMLSIQVHPSKLAAEQEFARESAMNIPLADRNYKDDNHKPELAMALNEFWLLHGFKGKELLQAMLQQVPELAPFIPVFEEGDYEALYRTIMQLPQQEVNGILKPLLDRIVPLYQEGALNRSQEDFWAARAALTYNTNGNIDRGIFSIYLLNLVKLQKGEAIFQDAGILHAYLEGPNVEIMANSDNVLRGGLTPKRIDIDELMKHVRFEPVDPWIIQGTVENMERVYKTPANDFELSAFSLQAGEEAAFDTTTADIVLITAGAVSLSSGNEMLELSRGQSAVIFASARVKLKAGEPAEVYRASVPVHNA